MAGAGGSWGAGQGFAGLGSEPLLRCTVRVSPQDTAEHVVVARSEIPPRPHF